VNCVVSGSYSKYRIFTSVTNFIFSDVFFFLTREGSGRPQREFIAHVAGIFYI
jgi:hypothetical protein